MYMSLCRFNSAPGRSAHAGQLAQLARMRAYQGASVVAAASLVLGGACNRSKNPGETRVLVVSPANTAHAAPSEPPLPFAVRLEDRVWAWFHRR